MKTITTPQLQAKLSQGPVALFDVRGDVEYEKGHISGAMTAPLGSLVFRVARVMNPDSEVIVYAEGTPSGAEGRDLAAEAVERLEGLGMRNVVLYPAGLGGWRAAGHEVAVSPFAKLHTQGPVSDCRPIVVDRERAYGGAFKGAPVAVEGAGG